MSILNRVTGGEVVAYPVGWASSKSPGLEVPGHLAGEGESLAPCTCIHGQPDASASQRLTTPWSLRTRPTCGMEVRCFF